MDNIMSSKLFTTRQGTVLLGVIAAFIAAIALLVYINHVRSNAGSAGVIRVLVAEKLIPAGTPGEVIRTTSGYFVPTNIPKDSVDSGAIVSPATLAGKVTTAEISRGQQITAADFGTGTTSVAGQIPAGERAVTLNLESPNQVGGQIAAGSPVDVWIAFNGQGTDGVTRPVVRELYQNMKVLNVASSGGNVTMEATPAQAGTLIFASQNATVYLTLRPAVGTTSHTPPVIGIANLLGARALRIGR